MAYKPKKHKSKTDIKCFNCGNSLTEHELYYSDPELPQCFKCKSNFLKEIKSKK